MTHFFPILCFGRVIFYRDLFLKVQKSWGNKHHKAYITGSADIQFIPVQRMFERSEYEWFGSRRIDRWSVSNIHCLTLRGSHSLLAGNPIWGWLAHGTFRVWLMKNTSSITSHWQHQIQQLSAPKRTPELS